MRIALDILNRRSDFAALLSLGETAVPLTITRKDDDTFASAGTGSYRFVIAYKNTLLAACALTLSSDSKTLTGTLSTNTAEAQAVFDSLGYTPELAVMAAVRLMDSDGDLVRNLTLSETTMLSTANDGGDITNVTISQNGDEAIPAGSTTLAVVFPTAFATAPSTVLTNVSMPAADSNALGSITVTGITTSGFTATFTAAPPVSGYTLLWYARA